MSATKRTAIRAGHILAFDGRGHRLLRAGVVVMEGDRILHVGPRFDGRVDETVDARDRVVTPGLISTHAHIGGSPLDRSFIEDRGPPQFWYSGLFEMLPVRSEGQDEEGGRACVDFSMAERLGGGVTTVMETGGLGEYVVARAAHYGIRVYVGQAFRSGRWLTRDGKRVEWEWNEEQGRQGLRRAVEFHAKHDGAHGGLVRCFFSPAQIDTCAPALLKEAKRFADEARVPYQVHTSQSVVEFNEMVARHGKTPIAWMRELGVLGPNTILGHAIIIGGSSWTNYPARDDLGRIAPGAKADLVLWKATSWRMTPLRDPIKNLVYNAADEDVDRVYVNGRLVVDGGRVLAADEDKILQALQAAGDRMWPRMAKGDWAGRSADQLSPQTYPGWSG